MQCCCHQVCAAFYIRENFSCIVQKLCRLCHCRTVVRQPKLLYIGICSHLRRFMVYHMAFFCSTLLFFRIAIQPLCHKQIAILRQCCKLFARAAVCSISNFQPSPRFPQHIIWRIDSIAIYDCFPFLQRSPVMQRNIVGFGRAASNFPARGNAMLYARQGTLCSTGTACTCRPLIVN